jgi:hypothetical protein
MKTYTIIWKEFGDVQLFKTTSRMTYRSQLRLILAEVECGRAELIAILHGKPAQIRCSTEGISLLIK